MDSSQIDIEPLPKTKQVAKIQLSVPQFVLNAKEMDVYVTMYTEDMHFVESVLVHIPPDVYSEWGTDDSHIVNYVLSELSVKREAPATTDNN